MLSDAQIDRYSRQIILPEVGARGQERLLSANVVVFLPDSPNSYLLLYLIAAGVGRVTLSCTDFDAADGWITDVARLNPDCRIDRRPEKLSCEDWLAAARPVAVVLDDVDEGQSALVNAACVGTATPLIWGRTAGAAAYMAVFAPPVTPGCYACAGVRNRVAAVEPAALHSLAASTLATLEAAEAVKLALDQKSALLGRSLVIDMASASITTLSFDGDRNCDVCAGAPRS